MLRVVALHLGACAVFAKFLMSHSDSRPKQFAVQAHRDFSTMTRGLFSKVPCVTKSVILPPGVNLDDARLAEGVVVNELHYELEPGQDVEWPDNIPFEVDVDGRLLPPCLGNDGSNVHYAIYPDGRFVDPECNYCNLHKVAHPPEGAPLSIPLPEKSFSGPIRDDATQVLTLPDRKITVSTTAMC